MSAILILEDRPLDRKFLATLLRSAGHVVTEASDGAEGLLAAERARPDLVISDILMPSVDGYEFVRRMRAVPALSRTPVIFYTATYHEREARTLALQCGVSDVVTKPSDSKTLLTKVAAVLNAKETPAGLTASPRDFDRDHLRVVRSALASKVEDYEASEQRMAAIVAFTHQIASERNPSALLQRVCDEARQVTLARQASIVLVVDGGQGSVRAASSGVDPEFVKTLPTPRLDTPVIEPVINRRQAVRGRNVLGHPQDIGLSARHPVVHSYLMVPIASPDRVYGWLGLSNKLGSDEFTAQDEEVALTLATHAGIAYENARLFEDLRHHSAALEQEVLERRRAETALRENQERTRFALAAAKTGVWELDLTTGQVIWNETLAAASGLTDDQMPHTNDEFVALMHPDDRTALNDGFERALRDNTDFVSEFRIVLRDGRTQWIAGRATAMRDEQGRPIRMVGIGQNISERKSLEDQLRQAQKMEAVGQLAGGVAHDFNNLLTAVRGFGELVAETLTEGDTRRSDMDQILKAAERGAALTRQLLTFSRKQIVQVTLVDINALVEETSTMLRRLIGEDITLSTSLAPNLSAVRADPGQLEQILMNLAVNARDAMPNGGRLSIETSNVILDAEYPRQHVEVEPGPYVMMAVTDTGTGMDARTKSRIFEPFFTTKERGRGTGLGLATVYGIVHQSGGHIWVYSEVGQGATFKVYLPQADRARSERPAAGHTYAPTGTETVLLVEDEEAVRLLARTLLARAGYRVLASENPEKARGVFDAHAGEIALLVADVIMPGMSGPALFERLSALQPSLKVLYISGYTDDAVVHLGGMTTSELFLQKPFTSDGLLAKVREALDR